jgi:hypothetical protein
MHIATETVELRDGNRVATTSGFRERSAELRTSVEGISALPSFNLHELAGDLEAFSGSETRERVTLCFKTKTGTALSGC